MTTLDKRDLGKRILSAQGHVGAIAEMIDADAPCVDILRQIQAVRGAMRAIHRTLWQVYLLDPHCGLHAPNRQKRERAWKELHRILVEKSHS